MTHNLPWSQRVSAAIIHRLPRIFLADPERVGLSIAFICVGIVSLANMERDSVVFTSAAILNWSATLILGGIFTILGMGLGKRLLERAGITLSMLGCLLYSGVAFSYGQTFATAVIAVMFLCLGMIKMIRLLISSAAQAELHKMQNGGIGGRGD